MRATLKYVLLIGIAQIGGMIFLFSFGYSVAHAATVYSQTDATGSYTNSGTGGLISPTGLGYDDLGTFDVGTSAATQPIYFTFTIQVHNNTSDSTSIEGRTVYLFDITDSTQCYSYTFTHADQLLTNDNAFHTFTDVLTDFNPSTSGCAGGTAKHWGFASYAVPESGYDNATYKTNSAGTHLFLRIGTTATPAPAPTSGTAFNVLLPNTNPDTRIATTTASTTVDFHLQYYYASTTPAASLYAASSTQLILKLTRFDQASTTQRVFSMAGADAWADATTTIDMPAHSVWSYYWEVYTPSINYGINYYNVPYGVLTGTYSFSALENAVLDQLGVSSLGDTSGLAVGTTTTAAPCGLSDISGCFQNALVYLFYPSTASLDQYATLWTTVENKPPFGYVLAVQQAVDSFTTSGTATFDLGTIPFVSTIFDPLRTGIAILMWLVFIVAFYHRLSTLDI